ncbi:MAG TPA: MFS transporter [Terracidiphilus sp.]|nr:MFS transporter [Terracidiphilus sp.]
MRKTEPGPAYRWQLVGMLWMVGFLNYADRQAIFSVFPLLQSRLHLTLTELGLLGSSFAWAYGLAAPFSGYIVDRIRRSTAILGGLEVWSWICAATALSGRLVSLALLRCGMGLGESLYFPASLSMMSDYHGPDTRSRALGLHQTSVYAGTIVGGFLAGWIAEEYNWRLPFVFFGAAGAVFGIVLFGFLIEPGRGSGEHRSENIHALPVDAASAAPGIAGFVRFALTTPAVWLLMAAFACANFVAVVLLVWMPSYLYRSFHMDLAMSGLTATAMAQSGSMAGTAVGGWLADRMVRWKVSGRVLVQAAGVLCGAPFVYLCCRTRAIGVLIVCLAGWGFFKGLYDANIFASLFDVIPVRARGAASGWMNTAGWLGGGGLAPVLVGFFASRHGLGPAMAMVSLVYILAGGLLLGVAFFAMAGRSSPAAATAN